MKLTLLPILLLWSTTAYAQCTPAPTALDDATFTHSTVALADVLANDTSAGQELTVAIASHNCSVTPTVDSFGLVEIAASPSQPLTGDCSITYTITDPDGQSDSGTISVTMETHIFSDGFESGSTNRWDSTAE